jgi:hypothetical protein
MVVIKLTLLCISDNGRDRTRDLSNVSSTVLVRSRSLSQKEQSVPVMTTNYLKTGGEPTPETSCISNIRQTMGNAQHSIAIMNQSLP